MSCSADVRRGLLECECSGRGSPSAEPRPDSDLWQANQTARIHQAVETIPLATLTRSHFTDTSGEKSEQHSLFSGRQPRRSITVATKIFGRLGQGVCAVFSLRVYPFPPRLPCPLPFLHSFIEKGSRSKSNRRRSLCVDRPQQDAPNCRENKYRFGTTIYFLYKKRDSPS